MTTKTVTFTDSTATGLRWEIEASQPTKIACRGTHGTRQAADLARRFRRGGWQVVVRGEGPGASDLRGA